MTDSTSLINEISNNAQQAMAGNSKALTELRAELRALNPEQARDMAAALEIRFGNSSNVFMPGVKVETETGGNISAITFEPTLQDRLTHGAHSVETTLAPIVEKGSSPEFFRKVRGYYDELPSAIRDYLNLVPLQIMATDYTPHADPSLHGTPTGYGKGETFYAVRGIEEPNKPGDPGDPEAGHIIMSEFYKNLGHGPHRSDDLHETFLHETGHRVDEVMGGVSSMDIPGYAGPEFKKSYEADLASMPQSVKDQLQYYLQAGERGRGEAFAQCFSYIEGGNDYERQLFTKYFPNSMKFVQEELQRRGLS